MKITYKIEMDLLDNHPYIAPVDVVQNDSNTRVIEMTLFEGSAPWNVPDSVTAAVAFAKPDGTRGLYDQLPNGTTAVTVSGNTVTATLAPQVTTVAGEVRAAIILNDKDLNQLATFPFTVSVARDPAAGKPVSNDYYKYTTMEAVNKAIGDLSQLKTTAKESLVAAINEVANQNGDGLSDAEKALILSLFRNAAYTSTGMGDTLTQLETLWSGSGDSGGGDSGEIEKTLTGITATYSGGEAAVGTAVTDLTGIVVTAIYSDGSTETVSGYTLSGTIAEGSNTITVSYGGKTTTFTVTGTAETGVSNETTWTSGVDYTFTPIADEYPVRSTGEILAYTNWTRTPYLYCEGASILRITAILTTAALQGGSSDNCFYTADKQYVGAFEYRDLASKEPGYYIDVPIPENAAYFILSGGNGRFPGQSVSYPDGQIKITPYE